jgi:biopolymer transport protein ExbD
MNKTPAIQETLSPNLIPMIDIMFLLLLFFMLGADMGHRELEDVLLPRADAAVQEPPQQQEGRLTINAYHRSDLRCAAAAPAPCRDASHWRLAVKGKDCSDPADLAAVLRDASASTRRVDAAGRPTSDLKVMIRADAAAPYAMAQRAMTVCAEQGVYRIEVGAAKPAQR